MRYNKPLQLTFGAAAIFAGRKKADASNEPELNR
jgi:hypothetical protein